MIKTFCQFAPADKNLRFLSLSSSVTKNFMRIKRESILLSIIYSIWSFIIFKMVQGFKMMYLEIFKNRSELFPKSTEILLSIPPFIWSLIFVLITLLILIKDLKFESKRLNSYLFFSLIIFIILFTIIIFKPLFINPSGLSSL
jgi:hypothetical protein